MSRRHAIALALVVACRGRQPTCADETFFTARSAEECIDAWLADTSGHHRRDVILWAFEGANPWRIRQPGVAAWMERTHRCTTDRALATSLEAFFTSAGYPNASDVLAALAPADAETCAGPDAAAHACDPLAPDASWAQAEVCAVRWAAEPGLPRAGELLAVLEAHPVWLLDARFGDAAVALAACGPEAHRARAQALVDAILPAHVVAATPVSCAPR